MKFVQLDGWRIHMRMTAMLFLALAYLAAPAGTASAQRAAKPAVANFCEANAAKVLRCRAKVSGNGQRSRPMWLACMGLPRNSQQHC